MPPTSPPEVRPRQRRRSLDVRAALLEVGLALLSDHDIEALTVDQIVGRAGVAKGSFYSHFDGKEALAASIAREIREDIERRVTLANEGVTDPAARIARAIFVYVRRALKEPLRARLMLKGAIADFAPDGALQRGVTADLQRGLDQGRLRMPSLAAGVLAVQGCAYVVVASAIVNSGGADAEHRAGEVVLMLLISFGLPEHDAHVQVQIAKQG